jgi:hypothetical protein
VYNPPVGTVLGAGSGRTLSVTFSPTDSADYGSPTATAHINVLPAAPAFSNLSASQSVTYGQPSITVSGKLAAVTAIPAGQMVTIAIGSAAGSATVQGDGTFSTTVNIHTLAASSSPTAIVYQFAATANFQAASDASTTLTVNRAVLTVTADSANIGYASPIPPLTFNSSGFVNGDTAAIITGALVTSAGPSSAPGRYPIAQGTLSAGSNYSIAFTPGTLTIAAPQAVSVTSITTHKNSKKEVTSITIRFTGALSSAGTAGNYHLTTVGKKSKTIAINPPQYSPASFNVTLTPTKPFLVSKSKQVQLKISGLIDSLGRTISDFVQVLSS